MVTLDDIAPSGTPDVIPVRVGGDHVGQGSEWHLGPEAGSGSYKPLGEQFLQGCHVLVKTDTTTVVAYISVRWLICCVFLH